MVRRGRRRRHLCGETVGRPFEFPKKFPPPRTSEEGNKTRRVSRVSARRRWRMCTLVDASSSASGPLPISSVLLLPHIYSRAHARTFADNATGFGGAFENFWTARRQGSRSSVTRQPRLTGGSPFMPRTTSPEKEPGHLSRAHGVTREGPRAFFFSSRSLSGAAAGFTACVATVGEITSKTRSPRCSNTRRLCCDRLS